MYETDERAHSGQKLLIGGSMSRDILNKLLGKRVVISGVRGRISPKTDKISTAKMLLSEIKVDGVDGDVDHMWITPPSNANTIKGEYVAMSGVIQEYMSLDEDDKLIMKLGLFNVRNFRSNRDREVSLIETRKSIEIGKIMNAKRIAKEKEKERAAV